jgi:hypothetical protein
LKLKGVSGDFLSATRFNLRLIDTKVFLITLVFSLFGGFYEPFIQSITSIYPKLGYSIVEMSAVLTIWGFNIFLLTSTPYFAALYSVCRKRFMGNVAGIIFSLITGSVVGRWIGGMLSLLTPWIGGILGLPLSVSAPPYLSLFNMLAVLLGAFGVCSTAYISEKWKTLLSRANAGDRPLGVTFVAVIYVISGILLSIIMGLLFGYGAGGSILSLVGNALILAGIFVFVIIMFALYIVIAIGLYRGRMWAWAVTFASTLVGIFSSLNAIILNSVFDRLLFDAWLVLKILVLVLGAAILVYLLQPHVRVYFGVVNPEPDTESEK